MYVVFCIQTHISISLLAMQVLKINILLVTFKIARLDFVGEKYAVFT